MDPFAKDRVRIALSFRIPSEGEPPTDRACTSVIGDPARNRRRSTKWHPSPMILPPPTSGSCVQWEEGIAPAFTVMTKTFGSIAPTRRDFILAP